MGSLGRGDKQDVVAMVEAKAGICCGRARQRTATSANLCLAFAMERFFSRKWWVGCRQGHSDTDGVFVLRRSSRAISGVHSEVGRSSPSRGERVKGMMTSGTARCRPMKRAAEGHIERAERYEEGGLKVRRVQQRVQLL